MPSKRTTDQDHRVTSSSIAARYVAKVRGLLSRYESTNELIRCLSQELIESQRAVEALRDGVTTSGAGDGIRAQGISDPTYRAIERILCNAEKRIAAMTSEIEEMQIDQAITDDLLRGLDEHLQSIARGRCIERRSWAFLSLRHHLSERQLVRRVTQAMLDMAHAYEHMFGDTAPERHVSLHRIV